MTTQEYVTKADLETIIKPLVARLDRIGGHVEDIREQMVTKQGFQESFKEIKGSLEDISERLKGVESLVTSFIKDDRPD